MMAVFRPLRQDGRCGNGCLFVIFTDRTSDDIGTTHIWMAERRTTRLTAVIESSPSDRLRLYAMLLLAMVVLPGCNRPQSMSETVYTDREPSDSLATGRFYHDREIPRFTAEGEAPWLDPTDRENAELPDRIVQGLRLKPSEVVADIGAGTGYLTFRLAEQVPSGRVLAVDIQQDMLDIIEARRDSLGIRNVDPILGAADDPNLPAESVDVILLVITYHELYHPFEMMTACLAALRDGGRLVVIEYRGEDGTIPVPDPHRISLEQARREIESVGFQFRQTVDILPQQHFLVFEKI